MGSSITNSATGNHNASTTPEITVTGTLPSLFTCVVQVSAKQNFVVDWREFIKWYLNQPMFLVTKFL